MPGKTFLKTTLAVCAFILLLLPFVQGALDIFPENELDGVSVKAKQPIWSWEGWFEGTYQKSSEAWSNQEFGFRNALVRLNNQLNWSLKGTVVESAVHGKDGCLFRKIGVDLYRGRWFDGEGKCKQVASEIKVFQDFLGVYGTQLCYIVAPGKQSYYQELLPEDLQPEEGLRNSKDAMADYLTGAGVNFVDMDEWFCKMKDTVSYPLFPQAGAHWGLYGQFLAADSLTRLIQQMTGVELPKLQCEELRVGKGDFRDDYDIGHTLNLIETIPTYPMAYPKIRIDRPAQQKPVNVLLIGDSFFQAIFKEGYMKKVLGGGEFWHLASTIEPSRPGFPMVKDLDLWESLTQFDLVLVTATGANTLEFGWDIHKKADLSRRNLVEISPKKFAKAIRDDPQWLQATKNKARGMGISLKEMIDIEAEFMVEQNYREQLK